MRTLTLLPILVCSVVGSALTVAKWLQLHRSRIAGDRLLLQVRTLISAHAYERALAVTRRDRSHAARLIERSLAVAGSPRERLAEHVEQAGRQLAREVDYGLEARALLHEAVPTAAGDWCESDIITAGEPYREILRQAETQQSDLIVMGVRGRGAAHFGILGATTDRVVREAACPVLTVRQGSQPSST